MAGLSDCATRPTQGLRIFPEDALTQRSSQRVPLACRPAASPGGCGSDHGAVAIRRRSGPAGRSPQTQLAAPLVRRRPARPVVPAVRCGAGLLFDPAPCQDAAGGGSGPGLSLAVAPERLDARGSRRPGRHPGRRDAEDHGSPAAGTVQPGRVLAETSRGVAFGAAGRSGLGLPERSRRRGRRRV